MTSLLIVSRVRFYREGLAELLSGTGAVRVAAVASNWAEAVAAAATWLPMVILLDVGVVTERARLVELFKAAPAAKVVALALSDLQSEVIHWVEAGIHGYVACDASVDDIVHAVNAAATGQVPCPPDLAAMLFRRLSENGRRAMRRNGGSERAMNVLTAREREILALIADGMSNKRMARQLGIAVGTIKNHVHNILQKLDLQHRSQITAWYYHHLPQAATDDDSLTASPISL